MDSIFSMAATVGPPSFLRAHDGDHRADGTSFAGGSEGCVGCGPALILAVAVGLFGADYHFIGDMIAGNLSRRRLRRRGLSLGGLIPRPAARAAFPAFPMEAVPGRGLAQNGFLVDGQVEYLGPLGERREWIFELIDPDWPSRGTRRDYSATSVGAAQPPVHAERAGQRLLAIQGNQLVDTATITTTDGHSHRLGLSLQSSRICRFLLRFFENV